MHAVCLASLSPLRTHGTSLNIPARRQARIAAKAKDGTTEGGIENSRRSSCAGKLIEKSVSHQCSNDRYQTRKASAGGDSQHRNQTIEIRLNPLNQLNLNNIGIYNEK